MTAHIPLTQGKTALVDDSDYAWLMQWRWCIINRYAGRRVTTSTGRQQSLLMQNVIMNPPQGIEVDHINHNPLDNRRSNLRLATQLENGRNKSKSHSRPSTSQYKGVSWQKQRSRWRAQITITGECDKRCRTLGYFDDEATAARAYDRAAIEHFGVFAHTNFPVEDYR